MSVAGLFVLAFVGMAFLAIIGGVTVLVITLSRKSSPPPVPPPGAAPSPPAKPAAPSTDQYLK